MSKAKYWTKTIGLWALQILLALLFMVVGVGKFGNVEAWGARFSDWGYPDNFFYVIGVLEVLGGIGVLIPRLAGYAAGGLIVIMIGATITHLIHGETNYTFTLLLIVVLGLVFYVRRPPFLQKNAPPPDPPPDPSL